MCICLPGVLVIGVQGLGFTVYEETMSDEFVFHNIEFAYITDTGSDCYGFSFWFKFAFS